MVLTPHFLCQVYAMLFTDLLLLTKEVGQHLKVVQDPMFLSQIMIQDFNCDDGTEFHITVVATLVSFTVFILEAWSADSGEFLTLKNLSRLHDLLSGKLNHKL